MKSIINTIVLLVITLLGFVAVFTAINASLDKSEVVSCLEWKEQARELRGFYLTQSEADMCERHGLHMQNLVK